MDLVSAVFTGECLCMLGEQAEGIRVLEAVVAKGSENPAYLPYLTRARAIIAAEGGKPPSHGFDGKRRKTCPPHLRRDGPGPGGFR